jgi:DNA-3-methyladenine glycosylase II
MAKLREQFSAAHGTTFEVAGVTMAALPTPEQLLTVREFAGLPEVKLQRLHAVATAALAGALDADTLRGQPTDAALDGLQRIPGIGPFYAQLVLLRATGVRDLLPTDEPRVRELARELYGLPEAPSVEEFARIAAPWSPWRTWVVVTMRAAARRLS